MIMETTAMMTRWRTTTTMATTITTRRNRKRRRGRDVVYWVIQKFTRFKRFEIRE